MSASGSNLQGLDCLISLGIKLWMDPSFEHWLLIPSQGFPQGFPRFPKPPLKVSSPGSVPPTDATVALSPPVSPNLEIPNHTQPFVQPLGSRLGRPVSQPGLLAAFRKVCDGRGLGCLLWTSPFIVPASRVADDINPDAHCTLQQPSRCHDDKSLGPSRVPLGCIEDNVMCRLARESIFADRPSITPRPSSPPPLPIPSRSPARTRAQHSQSIT